MHVLFLCLQLYREIGCWPWDVSAGIVIAEEAGGLVTGSHDAFAATSSLNSFGDVTEDILTGRKYAVVRAIAPNPVRFFLRIHRIKLINIEIGRD